MLPRQVEVMQEANTFKCNLLEWLRYVSARQAARKVEEMTVEHLQLVRIVERVHPASLLEYSWNDILHEKGIGDFELTYAEDAELKVCNRIIVKNEGPVIPFQVTAMRNLEGSVRREVCLHDIPATRRRLMAPDLVDSVFESQVNVAIRSLAPEAFEKKVSPKQLAIYEEVVRLRTTVGLKLQDALRERAS